MPIDKEKADESMVHALASDASIAPEDIIKEGDIYFIKKEVDLEQLITEQDQIILQLQEQLLNAQTTKTELEAQR